MERAISLLMWFLIVIMSFSCNTQQASKEEPIPHNVLNIAMRGKYLNDSLVGASAILKQCDKQYMIVHSAHRGKYFEGGWHSAIRANLVVDDCDYISDKFSYVDSVKSIERLMFYIDGSLTQLKNYNSLQPGFVFAYKNAVDGLDADTIVIIFKSKDGQLFKDKYAYEKNDEQINHISKVVAPTGYEKEYKIYKDKILKSVLHPEK